MRRYEIDPAERIREILGPESPVTDESVIEYSFDRGYERLRYQEKITSGGLSFEGMYHPDAVCEGGGICHYCGRTLP